MSATPPPPSAPPVRKTIDPRLVQWFAVELILDSRARLVEGGAGGDTRIDLAQVFVDLPVTVWRGRDVLPGARRLVRSMCADVARAIDSTSHGDGARDAARASRNDARPPRALIMGGPGSGKSTATAMIAQLLRFELLRGRVTDVVAPLQGRVREIVRGLDALQMRLGISVRRDLLPLRINLPELSRWMAARDQDDPAQILWRFLASRVAEHAALCGVTLELPPSELESLALSYGSALWVFDGLDEVPRSAGRDRLVAVIRAAALHGVAQPVVVTTRPQGYDGEFGELDSFVLMEMSDELALDYGQRLLRAWSGNEDPQLNDRLETLKGEFAKAEVQFLVRSPLHATMATLLVAEQGALPNARHLLFEHYFETIFKRELGKRGEHGVRLEDKLLLKVLHARAGLVLHTRSQERTGARPTLSPRELRVILEAILGEYRHGTEDAQAIADRMLRFAADRLVLLLRVTDGGYAFGIRSLQEFFAGIALLDGETHEVVRRLEAVALTPHWTNVLGLIVSGLAVPGAGRKARQAALAYTDGLCRTLNDRDRSGRAAATCVAGSRLAIAMLWETERYGGPWLHDPLWEIALEGARAPVQTRLARQARISSSGHETVSAQWDGHLEFHLRLGALAVGWQGGGRATWLQRVLEFARVLLDETNGCSRAGWHLLLPALQREDALAMQIADDHAPRTPEVGRRIVSFGFDAGMRGSNSWMAAFVDSHASWFSPGWLMKCLPGDDYPEPYAWPSRGVFSIRQLGLWADPLAPTYIQIERDLECVLECVLWEIDGAAGVWSHFSLLPAAESIDWFAWHKIAAFHGRPSKAHLADVLDAIAQPGAWEDSRRGWPVMAWPLWACLEFAPDDAALRTLAAAVRAGRLGDLADWKAAEDRWGKSSTPSQDELVTWLVADELPWTENIAREGRIFSLLFKRDYDTGPSSFERQISQVCRALQSGGRYQRRLIEWLRWMLRFYAGSTDVIGNLVSVELVERAPDQPDTVPYDVFFALDLLLPDLSGPSSERWYELLHQRGCRGANRAILASSSEELHKARLAMILGCLLARLFARPDQWGLLDAIWAVLHALPDGSLVGLHQPSLPPDASDRARASAAALSLLAGSESAIDVPAALASLVAMDASFDLRRALAMILARRGDHEHATLVLLHMLDATTDADEELRDVILAGLFQHLKRSAPPAFATADSWKECHLPEPYLSGQAPDVLPPRVVRLVELSNIRLFKETPDVDAPFPAPGPDQGQWVILVGENGVGKTTLLRALGLVLADPTVATRLLDENHPFVRNGGDGRIAVELDTGPVEVLVRRDARTEAVVPASNEKATRPWVIGYGVRRGNARGEKDRAPEWGPTGELHTLFDRPATLVNAVDWLLDLDRRVLNERRQYGPEPEDGGPRLNAATWQSVERALKALLGVTVIEPEERHVMVTHPEFGRVRLDELSDGYLTTTGWVIDLIARWVQRQEDLREAIGRDLLRQMTGIVLIDEIDLHLHPIWQMHIIDDMRRLFPRLSFVVTTHNPLTLQGARPGEIFIMRRGDGGRIELTQRDIQPGHDVDRVLFEQFGIAYTFDHDTRVLLERHRALLERGAAPDDAQRLELESRIAARLGRVGEVLADERGGEHDPSRPWSEEERRLLDQRARGKG